MKVKIEGVEKILGNQTIIRDINLDVGAKKFIGLIGPNGSGKSTLLKCLYRVLKPTKGAIWLDNKKLEELSVKDSAQKVGVVAQHNQYQFDFTVKEVVLMGRSPHKKMMDSNNREDYEITKEALKNVGMLGFINRSFLTLSGGEQQRVILARALAQKTGCLILDEPTNHLDIKYQLKLMDIVRNLKITVISAIHDLNIAAAYCDEIYVLKDGKIIEKGTPEKILTEKLIKEVYEVDAKVMIDKESNQVHVLYYPGRC